MNTTLTRRQMLRLTGHALAAGALSSQLGCVATRRPTKPAGGAVAGDPLGAPVGERVLAEGGNAVDAAVAAALVACVTGPSRCGIGGYGGHLTVAPAGRKKVVSIDFNSIAPAAAREDMYPLDANGDVIGKANLHGWLAAGVPGTMAGLQFALERFGTRSFEDSVAPAIAYARDGFPLTTGVAAAIRAALPRFRNDPGSAKLYLKNGEPPEVGEVMRNPDLAALLETLAQRNSVDSFYRGDIGLRIAESIQRGGGLVTAADMSALHAREVTPLQFRWRDYSVFTAPLTAGGLTPLEALNILAALNWAALPPSPAAAHARLEALRLAWKDRLELLGDPEFGPVPIERLLSRAHSREQAGRIEHAVRAVRLLDIPTQTNFADGTTNISSVDTDGTMVALTLTHGAGFGAQVTVDGLGLTLGHGMSRFNPRPGHPNSVGPRKRPLHNMCPSIVLHHGTPVMAAGGVGGVRIPNALFDVLTYRVLRGLPMEEAIAAPRMHCIGGTDVTLENAWPKEEADYLRKLGFKLQTGGSAFVSAVSFDPRTGECRAAAR